MSPVQPLAPTSPETPRRGRGAIIAGSILLTISILGGIIGSVVTAGQFSGSELNDVVIDGAMNPAVPGKLTFRIVEPLDSDGDDPELRVGIAVDYTTLPLPDCVLQDADGSGITLSAPSETDQLLRGQSSDEKVLGSATLGPGRYEAICSVAGEPSSSDATFTVGRLFGLSDFTDPNGVFAPFLWFLAIGAVATIMFVIGAILLIVGLVRRSRARKDAARFAAPYGPGPGGATPGFGAPWQGGDPTAGGRYPGGPANGYPVGPGQVPAGQGPGGGPPSPPAWPGPHPPGPPEMQPPLPPPYTPPAAGPGETAPPTPTPPTDQPPEQPGWTVPPSKKQ